MSDPAPVRLRGHHLICLQFFHGEGYSADFVENLTHAVGRARTVGAIVVDGVDNICAACPELGPDNRCASTDAGGEVEISRIDGLALSIMGVEVGKRLTLAEARRLLEADAMGVGIWRAQACVVCTWESACERGWNELLEDTERAARRPDAG